MRNGVTTAIASKNEARGFYGTIEQHAEPNQAWALAVAGSRRARVAAIRPSATSSIAGTAGTSPIRSRRDPPRAIDEAIERWMGRRIDAAIESELGIPEGLPYLTGFVCMHEALLQGAD